MIWKKGEVETFVGDWDATDCHQGSMHDEK